MDEKKSKSVAIIVAHPDDETLWAGGTILGHPEWDCFILSLCRADDPDRAPKFYKALKILNARGVMGSTNDDPSPAPLDKEELQKTVLELLPKKHYDLIITHNEKGEYTRNIRHEEISREVLKLWQENKISADELWTFAYEDGNNSYFPKAIVNAHLFQILTEEIWLQKFKIMTEVYGFDKNSWETETTPLAEAFWQFKQSDTGGSRT
jgi:LmbE family N-acetylglucosaminyl deacetylase